MKPMEAILETLRIVLPTAYALCEVAYLSYFWRDDQIARRVATPLLAGAVGLHLLYITLRWIAVGHIPLDSAASVLTMIAFATAFVHLMIEVNYRNQGAGAFLIGFVFVFQLAASASLPDIASMRPNPLLHSHWIAVHSGAAILGYSGFAVSAAYGILFLLLYSDIKSSRFGRIYERFPTLELLAGMTIRAAWVGLAFLTFSIVAGIVWSVRLQYAFFQDPKFIITILLWVVYGVCLLAHRAFGLHQRRFVYFSLVGFMIMIFSMAAVNVVFRSFHRFT